MDNRTAAVDAKMITVNGSTTTAIRKAINGAESGDTIFIPAGFYEYTDVILVGIPNLTIRGAGVNYKDPEAGTYIYTDRKYVEILKVEADNVRITGIAFRGHPLPPVGTGISDDVWTYGVSADNADNLRIDHSYFTSFGRAGVGFFNSTGLVDHNWFVSNYVNGGGYGAGVYDNYNKKVFIEDNYFEDNRHDVAAGLNGSYVARHNYCYNSMATINPDGRIAYGRNFDAHGPDKSGKPGTYQVEIYENYVEHAKKSGYGSTMRGVEANAFIFRNTFKNVKYGVRLHYFNADPGNDVYWIWDNTYKNVDAEVRQTSEGIFTVNRYAPPVYVPDPYPHPLNDDPTHPGPKGVFTYYNFFKSIFYKFINFNFYIIKYNPYNSYKKI